MAAESGTAVVAEAFIVDMVESFTMVESFITESGTAAVAVESTVV